MKVKAVMIDFNKKEFITEIEAEPLPNNLGLELYCTKEKNPYGETWHHVIEGSTGTLVGGGWTLEQALESVRNIPDIKKIIGIYNFAKSEDMEMVEVTIKITAATKYKALITEDLIRQGLKGSFSDLQKPSITIKIQ